MKPHPLFTIVTLLASAFAANALTFSDWQLQQFTAAELLIPEVSGELADPDADGLQNYLEFATGWNPKFDDGYLRPKVYIGPDASSSCSTIGAPPPRGSCCFHKSAETCGCRGDRGRTTWIKW